MASSSMATDGADPNSIVQDQFVQTSLDDIKKRRIELKNRLVHLIKSSMSQNSTKSIKFTQNVAKN